MDDAAVRRRRGGPTRQHSQVIKGDKVGRNDPAPAAAGRNTRNAAGLACSLVSRVCVRQLRSSAARQIWPDSLARSHAVNVEPVAVEDRPLWDEFGWRGKPRRAVYDGPVGKFTATAWRLQGLHRRAGLVSRRIRPADCVPVQLATLLLVDHARHARCWPTRTTFSLFDGWRPAVSRVRGAVSRRCPSWLRRRPAQPARLPARTGPGPQLRTLRAGAGLAGPVRARESRPSLAGFEDGAEAQLAVSRPPAANCAWPSSHYPTPQFARERLAEFQRIAGLGRKRDRPVGGRSPLGQAE